MENSTTAAAFQEARSLLRKWLGGDETDSVPCLKRNPLGPHQETGRQKHLSKGVAGRRGGGQLRIPKNWEPKVIPILQGGKSESIINDVLRTWWGRERMGRHTGTHPQKKKTPRLSEAIKKNQGRSRCPSCHYAKSSHRKTATSYGGTPKWGGGVRVEGEARNLGSSTGTRGTQAINEKKKLMYLSLAIWGFSGRVPSEVKRKY